MKTRLFLATSVTGLALAGAAFAGGTQLERLLRLDPSEYGRYSAVQLTHLKQVNDSEFLTEYEKEATARRIKEGGHILLGLTR